MNTRCCHPICEIDTPATLQAIYPTGAIWGWFGVGLVLLWYTSRCMTLAPLLPRFTPLFPARVGMSENSKNLTFPYARADAVW